MKSGKCDSCERPMADVIVCRRCGSTKCRVCYGSYEEFLCKDCIGRAPRVELMFDYGRIRAGHWRLLEDINKLFDKFKGDVDASETMGIREAQKQRRIFYPSCVEDLQVLTDIMKLIGADNPPAIEEARIKLIGEGRG